jgi:hypothetical protein
MSPTVSTLLFLTVLGLVVYFADKLGEGAVGRSRGFWDSGFLISIPLGSSSAHGPQVGLNRQALTSSEVMFRRRPVCQSVPMSQAPKWTVHAPPFL